MKMNFSINNSFDDSNPLYMKSKALGSRIVKLYKYLNETQHETVMAKQILRSGTSVGANIAEAQFAASRNDFVNKLRISLKECAETLYWLDLLLENNYIATDPASQSLYQETREILKMLISSISTMEKTRCS